MITTWTVDKERLLPGWTIVAPDRLRNAHGTVQWFLHPPVARVWGSTGVLVKAAPVGWELSSTAEGARLEVAAPASVDVAELSPAVAGAEAADRSAAMTVIGSYARLGPPADLARFLVGGTVLDTTDFGGRRCPSEQTALSMYRVARLRGGPFWEAVGEHLAGMVASRAAGAPAGLPVHDLLGRGETHGRFLADALLLLLASGRHDEAERAAESLTALAVPWDSGTWFLHDTLERDSGSNHLVLNTHLHTMVALAAAGRSVTGARRALDAALALPVEGWRSWVVAGLLASSDALRAVVPMPAAEQGGDRAGWLARRAGALAHRAQEMAARSRARRPHLRLPGGWCGRDVGLPPAPGYLTVNLSDLAVLERNQPTPTASAALRAGLRYARRCGYFRAQRRAGDPLVVLVPSLLRNAGLRDAALRAADAAVAAGWHPAVGWPDHEDHLWPALAPGTP